MTRPAPRSHLHSARLVRVLSGLGLVDASQPAGAFAEKLGHWVGIKQAIALRAAHSPLAGAPISTPMSTRISALSSTAAPDARHAGLDQAFADMCAGIAQCIRHGTGGSGKSGKAHLDLPSPKPGLPSALAGSYEPYRRHYQAHQREMELALRPWRARLQQALASGTPAQRQLATLDAALDGILAERETQLLAGMATRLERRFAHLRADHLHALPEAGPAGDGADNVAQWSRPGGWLARFGQELQSLLLAEWDLRLQPTLGLLEALHNHTDHTA